METNLTNPQMIHAQHAYLCALAAAGGTVDGITTTFTKDAGPCRTKTEYLVVAWKTARLLNLPVMRPRGPVDAGDLARSILTESAKRGCDAFTGLPPVEEVTVDETPTVYDTDELEPEHAHRCKDNGGYCGTCLSDIAA